MATTTPQTTYFGDVNVYGNTTMSGTLAVLGTPALFRSNLGVVTSGTSLIGTPATPFQYAWMNAANTTSVNFLTNIPGPIGVGTAATGTQVTVQGNVVVSNSVSTTNVNVTTSINTASVMNVNFVTRPGGVGIGTNVVGSAALAVLGTMNSVASFQTANLVLSGTLNVGASNLFTLGTSNIGVGTAPVTGGATLAIQGFASVSNAISTTNVYVTTANVGTLNTGALVNSSGFFGFGTAGASGTTAYVRGDLRSSNSINAPIMTSNGLIATGRINVATVVARSNVGIGGAPDQGGATLEVIGNVFLSNTFTTPQVFAGSMNVSNRSNIDTGIATSNVLIGPTADLYKGFNLAVDGNVVISNALQTTGVTSNLINVSASANLLAIMNAFAIGTTTLLPGALITINGNLYVSNTLTGSNVITTRSNAASTTNGVSVTARTSVGISTTPVTGGANLAVQGNLFASNALTAKNVFATTSANVLTLNTGSIFTTSSGFLGISTTAPSGTAMYVSGNVYVSNALTTNSMNVTNSNAQASNAATIYASSNVGIGTAPVTGGATLAVQGNAFISNALTTANVYATTSANTITLNTNNIFTASSFLGVGTSVPSDTSLYVSGNVFASNALVAPNVTALTMNVTGRATTQNFSMATGQFLGIGGATPTGNALEVSGNAFVSNSVTATNVFSTLANVTTLNTISIFTRNSFLGIGTANPSGTSLFVPGNVYASTDISTPAMFTSAANVSTTGNALSVAIGTASVGAVTGATLSVDGNLYASNAITTTNIVATSANVALFANVVSMSQIPAIGIGASVVGAGIRVSGNVVASNSVTTNNVFATSVNTATMNVLSISSQVRVGGGPPGTALYIQGNLYASNALTIGGNITATSMNLASTLNTGAVTMAVLVANALGWSNTNIFISNSITTTNVITTNVNAASYVGTSGSIGINTVGSGYALEINGNLASSNTLWNLPDVSALQSIYYVDDITKRSPHLRPTRANAAAIQSWISATCNAASPPETGWWAPSTTMVTGNAATLGSSYLDNWSQPVLLPDGRVLLVPEDYSNVGFFNPFTNEFSKVAVSGMKPGVNNKWRSGVLIPNGNVYSDYWYNNR